MRTFAKKTKASTHTKSTKPLKPIQRLIESNSEAFQVVKILAGAATTGVDFSRIPVHPKTPASTQRKLNVNTAGDLYEREADHMATQVMRMPAPSMPMVTPRLAPVRESLQRKPITHCSGSAQIMPTIVDKTIRSSGKPLDSTTRNFMESRFSHDFSHVRVHDDSQAVNSARSVNAQAYTVGPNLVFGTGQYAPQTITGRSLIAHELSHVIQQRAAMPLISQQRGFATSATAHLSPVSGYRLQRREQNEGELMPMDAFEFRNEVITATLALVTTNAPTLGPALQRTLEGPTALPALVTLLADAQRRSVGQNHSEQLDAINTTAALLVKTFILDPNTSSLDLLPEAQRDRVRNFDWQENDYPGGITGDNEGRANQMSRQLSTIRPERRANSGADAVVTRAQHTAAVQRHIRDNLVAIPAFPAPAGGGTAPHQRTGHNLYRNAQAAFMLMRDAALLDGVPLVVLSSYRDPAVAEERARAAGNPAAVASFSSHSLGLAVDLRMSLTYTDASGGQQNVSFSETSTRPMQNVVDMRESPVHKWIFLHGAEYGWFPYQNEPWHWEYNPNGFRDQFVENLNPTQP
jgi:hypothetical protein